MTENKLWSMYELTKTFENAISMVDEDWCLTDEAVALISWAKMDITQKTENIFKVIRFMTAQVEMMTAEKSYINWKQNTVKKNIAKIRELMALWLDTVWAETDKKWKKTQKIKTLKWTIFYKFSENVEYNNEEIEEKYVIKKEKLKFADGFSLEELQKVAPKMVEVVKFTEIDHEQLKFDYERAVKNNEDSTNKKVELPKWITIKEEKTLSVRQ